MTAPKQAKFPLTDPELEQQIEQLRKKLALYDLAEQARGEFDGMLTCWQYGHNYGDQYCNGCGCHYKMGSKEKTEDILALMKLLGIKDRGNL